MFGSDDDTDFIPSNNSNSKLASLFGGVTAREDGDTTFTFAAPKQPKATAKDDGQQASPNKQASAQQISQTSVQSASSNKLSIIIVKAVHTYKLEDGQYVSQGKLGAAILGNSTVNVYQLLLYKGKQQHITSARITHDFQFTVQADKYCTFYNDKGENWSIHFEDDTDGQEFAREIGLARVASNGGEIQRLAAQVLALPADSDGQVASVGDSMEIFYSVRTYSSGKLGQLVESNRDATKPQRVKIRKNVWEEGLIGISKGTKIIIFLPPTMVHPWKSDVRPDTSLAVEVDTSRLKQARKSPPLLPSRLPSSAVRKHSADSSTADSGADEQSVRARVATISEALTGTGGGKTQRASIISRMAKMGQATLPLSGRNVSDSEETGDDSSTPSAAVFKASKSRIVKSRPTPTAQAPPSVESLSNVTPAPSQVTLYQSVPAGWQQAPYPMAPYGVGQFQASDGSSTQLVYPVLHSSGSGGNVSAVTSPTSSDMSVFLSETRAHNAEVRMAVSKVADKVDNVLTKLERVEAAAPQVLPRNQLLDSTSLLASVQRIVAENEALQAELTDKRGKLEIQNDRIYQLLNTSHRYLEQSNASSADTETAVASLREEKTRLAEQLAEASAQVEALRLREEERQRREAENAARLEAQQKQLDEQMSSLSEEMMKNASVTSVMEVQRRELDEHQLACAKMSADLVEQAKELGEKEAHLATLRDKLKQTVEANDADRKTIAELERSMMDLQSFKEELENNVKVMSQKLKSETSGSDQLICDLTDRYSTQIRSLEAEVEVLRNQIDTLKSGAAPPNADLVNAKVKLIMNNIWRCLQGEFLPDKTYDGEIIRQTVMRTIRDITCQLTGIQSERPAVRQDAKITVEQESSSQAADIASEVQVSIVEGVSDDSPSLKEVTELTEEVETAVTTGIETSREEVVQPPREQDDSSCNDTAAEPELPPLPNLEVEVQVKVVDETESAKLLKIGLVDSGKGVGEPAIQPKLESVADVSTLGKAEDPELECVETAASSPASA